LENIEEKLQSLIKDYLDWKMKNTPTISTMMGFREYNDLIEDFSPEAIKQCLYDLKNYDRRLSDLPYNLIRDIDSQIDYELLKRDIKGGIRDIEKFSSHKRNPSLYPSLALQSLYLLSDRTSIPSEERIEKIIKRMEKIPAMLRQGMENLDNPPQPFLEVARGACLGGSLFLPQLVSSLGKEMPRYFSELDKNKEDLLKALNEFKDFLEKDLSGRAKGDYATGKELFDELLYEDYMLDYDSEEVLEKGRSIFEETQKELESLAAGIDKNKTWKELYSMVRLDYPSADKVVETYEHYMVKAKEFVIKKDLVDLPPDETIEVKATPEFLRIIMPTAAYNPPAVMDKFKKGRFMVTPVDTSKKPEEVEGHLQDHNMAEIITTTLHEAYPGHHLQMTFGALHPRLMRRFVFTPILAEGWALYCEQFMKDYGYLEDPLVELSWLRRVLWRSLRVIIDVSLHTKGMSCDEAIELMVKELLFSEGSARSEVIRYTMMPTQPLSYIMGKIELLKLREDYRSLLGDDYSIKRFHRDLLSCGTLPIKLLKKDLLRRR